jgi:cation/acetate symporter
VTGVIVGLVFTVSYIAYFKFVAPDQNTAANWWFGISPEGIGVIGALMNFSIAALVSRFQPPPPRHVQELVENIRIPRGVEAPHEH